MWSFKDIKNYDAFTDSHIQVIPKNYNKLDQSRLWKLSQPAYLRYTPQKFSLQVHEVVFGAKAKQVAWDGTWNMPL